MKAVFHCVACSSQIISKKIGYFLPFLSPKMFDYPFCQIQYMGSNTFYPTLFTNSIKCRSCGLVFSQLRPDADEMERYYKNYGSDSHILERGLFEPDYSNAYGNPELTSEVVKNKEQTVLNFLNGTIFYEGVATILDYGGGNGISIPDVFEHCSRYVYDLSTELPIPGVTKVKEINNIGTMDIILLMEVLEHVSYPILVLNQLKPLCKEDTKILITVPHDTSDDLNIEDFPHAFHEHINFFSTSSVTALVRSNGFKVLKIDTTSHFDPRSRTDTKGIFCLISPNW